MSTTDDLTWRDIIKAVELGLIEEAKRIPGLAFTEKFLESLHDQMGEIDQDRRRQIADAILHAKIDDVVALFTVESAELRRDLSEVTLGFYRLLERHSGEIGSQDERMATIESIIADLKQSKASITQTQSHTTQSTQIGHADTVIINQGAPAASSASDADIALDPQEQNLLLEIQQCGGEIIAGHVHESPYPILILGDNRWHSRADGDAFDGLCEVGYLKPDTGDAWKLTREGRRAAQRLSTPAPPAANAKKGRTMGDATGYDLFISYRRQEPDKQFARDLLRRLEDDGYVGAIDERDFAPNQPFLNEMERCIRESRFTLCVMSPRYFESGNCEEEAIICKVLDMGERRRRLVPLVIEKVEMPTWLYGITGIDFTDNDPLVDPYERLTEMLGNPR